MTTEEFDNQTGRFRVREVSGYDFGWVIIDTRDGTEVGSDICEPEDALLVRDFAWVREALNAVDAERDAAVKRAEEAEQKLAAAQGEIETLKDHVASLGYVLAAIDRTTDAIGMYHASRALNVQAIIDQRDAATRRAKDAEARLAAAQAALSGMLALSVARPGENWQSWGDRKDSADAAAKEALSGGTAALDARIVAEKQQTRTVILRMVTEHIKTAGKTLYPLESDESGKAFRAALDAALVRAREEMREQCAESVRSQLTSGLLTSMQVALALRAIAALPTTGGEP